MEYAGNYDYYLEKRAPDSEEPQETPRSEKDSYLQKKEQESLARRRKSRIERLEAEISEIENSIRECDTKLEDDEINRNAEAAQAVFEEKTALEETLTAKYDEWETLMAGGI
jgi:ATP-binding cassette subfamily F protein 3